MIPNRKTIDADAIAGQIALHPERGVLQGEIFDSNVPAGDKMHPVRACGRVLDAILKAGLVARSIERAAAADPDIFLPVGVKECFPRHGIHAADDGRLDGN